MMSEDYACGECLYLGKEKQAVKGVTMWQLGMLVFSYNRVMRQALMYSFDRVWGGQSLVV